MTESMSKHVQIGEWIFEIKMVRALKVSEYGKPYSAIANCNVNGDTMYIDGLLAKNAKIFTKSDFNSFNDFCYKMGLKQFSYHRYQNGQSIIKDNMVSSPDDRDSASIILSK
ncbi:hypothetical protein [Candidatus Colwellia aromaticivorans]|uniref:hypothetical protein n=1 Tax=Candidatus Colwellia aromaticivorans TaxID=2267621 RepID=UPI00109BEB19|nr:hypothetical protein [Candidatus Colwellia aromaticivorans]